MDTEFSLHFSHCENGADQAREGTITIADLRFICGACKEIKTGIMPSQVIKGEANNIVGGICPICTGLIRSGDDARLENDYATSIDRY